MIKLNHLLNKEWRERLSRDTLNHVLSRLSTDLNWWRLSGVALMVLLSITTLSLVHITKKLHDNERVIMVRLAPNGTASVSHVNFSGQPTYFRTTLESLLSSYVIRRFSQHKDSIQSDYGFSLQFMAPKLKTQFLREFNAQSKAQTVMNCTSCPDLSVSVGAIEHQEEMGATFQTSPNTLYRSSVFVTLTDRDEEGHVLTTRQGIVSLVWRVTPLSSLSHQLDTLRANPIGLKVVREHLQFIQSSSTGELPHDSVS